MDKKKESQNKTDGDEVKSGGETEGDEGGDDDMYRYQSSTDDEVKEKMVVLKKIY